jgi:hypothetical protein
MRKFVLVDYSEVFVVKMTMASQNTLPLYKVFHKNYLQHCESVRAVNRKMDTFAL